MTCTNRQVELLMKIKNHKKKISLATIAAKTSMSGKTARKYLNSGKLPSELRKPRIHRTRNDPFAEHQDTIKAMLDTAPDLQAKTMLYYLMEQYPEQYKESHLRSLQRRFVDMRLNSNKTKNVIFPQDIKPGKQSQSDWFSMNQVSVTIAGKAFPHLLFHFMLPYSKWEDVMICYSESFETLSKGFSQAVSKLSGALPEHRTDNLSAATKVDGGGRAFTDRWQEFMDHYGVKPSRNNPGVSNENGSVEKSHDLLRNAINQHLMLRKSRDFSDLASYQKFLNNIIERRNDARKVQVIEELAYLQPLPARGWNDPKICNVRVSPSSIINIEGCRYSVPSRLISYHLRAHIYAEFIDLYYGNKKLETIPRNAGKNNIDYRHIIDSLVRKPGAFENYQYKENLFPSMIFRFTYDELVLRNQSNGHKDYLKILQMAKCYGESKVAAALELCKKYRMEPLATVISEQLKEKTLPIYETKVRDSYLNEYDDLLEFKEAS